MTGAGKRPTRPGSRAAAAGAALVAASLVALLLASGHRSFTAIDAVAVGSVFAGGVVSGLAGFAFSATAGSLMLHWVQPTATVPLLLACSITTQLMSIASLRRIIAWRNCLPLLLGGIFGIPVGAMLLEDVNPRGFAVGFGVFLVCYSAYMLARPSVRIRWGGRLPDIAAGFAGGVTGGSIAFPGAIPTLWYCLRGVSKEAQRGMVQPFILIMQMGTLLYFSKLGILTGGTVGLYLWCAPATLAGTWIGLALFRVVNDLLFRRIVLVFLLFSGVVLAL